jgi:hypothetical protein
METRFQLRMETMEMFVESPRQSVWPTRKVETHIGGAGAGQ